MVTNGSDKFQGYVTAKLEDMGEDLKEIKTEVKNNSGEIGKVKVRAATISGTIALIVTIVVILLGNIIKSNGG